MTLTREQVEEALNRLEQGWPDDLELFVGDGSLYLYESPVPHNDSGAVPSDESLNCWPGIRIDGGGN